MPIAHRSNLGSLIRHYRTLRGMSQSELAVAAGVSTSAIAGIEQKRRHDPTWSFIQRIAHGLRVELADLATLGERDLAHPPKSFAPSGG